MKQMHRSLLIATATAAIAACGGDPSTNDASATGKAKQVSGPITGFGSVIVNGKRYGTDNAQFDVDENPASETDLEVGMIVKVAIGTDGNAERVEYDENVEGPVTAIDLAAGEITVLGQTVFVDELTNFEGVTLETLAVGDRVEVSGSPTEGDAILASYIELEADPGSTDGEVQGRVAALDEAAQEFLIGSLIVDYSAAQEFEVAGGQLANGQLVEVEGTVDGNVLRADSVESISRTPDSEEDSDLEVAGLIKDLREDGFSIDELQIVINEATEIENGTAEDLVVNVPVVVEGLVNAEGQLVAEEIEIQPPVEAEAEGTVESVDPDTGILVISGGIEIRIVAETRVEDDSERAERNFDINSIQVGDHVEVSGFDDGGVIVALYLEREDADLDEDGDGDSDGARVRGEIESIDGQAGTFVLRGVTVEVTDTTEFDGYADSAEFFASAQAGDHVSAEGEFAADSTNRLIADEVEREDAPGHRPDDSDDGGDSTADNGDGTRG